MSRVEYYSIRHISSHKTLAICNIEFYVFHEQKTYSKLFQNFGTSKLQTFDRRVGGSLCHEPTVRGDTCCFCDPRLLVILLSFNCIF